MNRELIDALAKKFVDEGRLIEAGWQVLLTMLPPTIGDTQRSEMRKAFFAGAQHLWGSVFSILDGGREETAADMKRMTQINNELDDFYNEMKHGQRAN